MWVNLENNLEKINYNLCADNRQTFQDNLGQQRRVNNRGEKRNAAEEQERE